MNAIVTIKFQTELDHLKISAEFFFNIIKIIEFDQNRSAKLTIKISKQLFEIHLFYNMFLLLKFEWIWAIQTFKKNVYECEIFETYLEISYKKLHSSKIYNSWS